jgi:acyl dehydratase
MRLQVGQSASIKRTLTQSDFDRFAALSGDDNPIHIDPAFSAQAKFGRTVAHGMFLYSVVCSVLGTRLPGPGTLQIEQELMFPTATPAGEEVEVRVEVADAQPSGGVADLTTKVVRPNGDYGLQGRTLVRVTQAASKAEVKTTSHDSKPNSHHSFKGMVVGQRAETIRTFTVPDLTEYISLTGDTNPVYEDEEFVRRLGLKHLLVPASLLAGLFSYLLGTELPGRGTNYLKQRLQFFSPAYVGQAISASVEVVRFRPEKQLVNLSTTCANPAGDVLCWGEALVLVSDVEGETR